MFRLSNRHSHSQGDGHFWEAAFILIHAQTQALIDYRGSSFRSDDERRLYAIAFTLRRMREELEPTTTILREVNRGVTCSTLDDRDVSRIVRLAYSTQRDERNGGLSPD